VITVQSGDPELLPLLHIAAQLRQLPREDFKTRLKSDLERRSSMATTAEPIAAVRTFASPRLSFKSPAKAIEFYKQAFGAVEKGRMPGPDGKGVMHAELKIGDSFVYLSDEIPGMRCRSPENLERRTNSPSESCLR
jgi:hypothetical protein